MTISGRGVLYWTEALARLSMAPILSPDSIGLVGGDFTELGVRSSWATE